MAKSIFQLRGIDEYMDAIQQAGEDIVQAAVRSVDAGSDVILEGMQRRVPKDEMNLHDHLEKEMTVEGDLVVAEVGIVDADADTTRYGTVQEFGSSSVPAQSYVRATMDSDRRKAMKAMKDELKGYVDS